MRPLLAGIIFWCVMRYCPMSNLAITILIVKCIADEVPKLVKGMVQGELKRALSRIVK